MKRAVHLITLVLGTFLIFPVAFPAEPLRVTENLRMEEVFSPTSALEKHRLALVLLVTLTFEREIMGAVALYDDPTTERAGDYLEIYNATGDLLMISWFDRFGIQRTAIDRGLLEEADELEGILVLLLEGIPL